MVDSWHEDIPDEMMQETLETDGGCVLCVQTDNLVRTVAEIQVTHVHIVAFTLYLVVQFWRHTFFGALVSETARKPVALKPVASIAHSCA